MVCLQSCPHGGSPPFASLFVTKRGRVNEIDYHFMHAAMWFTMLVKVL